MIYLGSILTTSTCIYTWMEYASYPLTLHAVLGITIVAQDYEVRVDEMGILWMYGLPCSLRLKLAHSLIIIQHISYLCHHPSIFRAYHST